MAATREDVDRWIDIAKKNGDKFVLSVCDTFEWDDYPVFFKSKELLEEKYWEYEGKNMQRVNEIIRINDDGSVNENLNMRDL
jgi:hypothetical protein